MPLRVICQVFVAASHSSGSGAQFVKEPTNSTAAGFGASASGCCQRKVFLNCRPPGAFVIIVWPATSSLAQRGSVSAKFAKRLRILSSFSKTTSSITSGGAAKSLQKPFGVTVACRRLAGVQIGKEPLRIQLALGKQRASRADKFCGDAGGSASNDASRLLANLSETKSQLMTLNHAAT